MLRLLMFVLVATACAAWPIDERAIPGTYVMNRGRAADTLMVGSHGRYRRVYALQGEPVAIDSGTWTYDTYHGDVVVRFSSFWQRWQNEMDASWVRRSPLQPAEWIAHP